MKEKYPVLDPRLSVFFRLAVEYVNKGTPAKSLDPLLKKPFLFRFEPSFSCVVNLWALMPCEQKWVDLSDLPRKLKKG